MYLHRIIKSGMKEVNTEDQHLCRYHRSTSSGSKDKTWLGFQKPLCHQNIKFGLFIFERLMAHLVGHVVLRWVTQWRKIVNWKLQGSLWELFWMYWSTECRKFVHIRVEVCWFSTKTEILCKSNQLSWRMEIFIHRRKVSLTFKSTLFCSFYSGS